MTRDLANQISVQFEQLGWNHTLSVKPDGVTLLLQVSEMTGAQIGALFNVLAPGGVPAAVTVSLSAQGLVVT